MMAKYFSASALTLVLTASFAHSEEAQQGHLPLTEKPSEAGERWHTKNGHHHSGPMSKHFRHQHQELTNLQGFHMLDFVGWNNRDFEVFRHYHTDDVEVVGFGSETVGIEAHVEWAQWVLAADPNSYILFHNPSVAQGDWTCVVGGAPEVGPIMLTVAQWRNGAIAKEYLLGIVDVLDAPEIEGEPIADITNTGKVRAQTGAVEDWSCIFGKTAQGQYTATVFKPTEPDSVMAFATQ